MVFLDVIKEPCLVDTRGTMPLDVNEGHAAQLSRTVSAVAGQRAAAPSRWKPVSRLSYERP